MIDLEYVKDRLREFIHTEKLHPYPGLCSYCTDRMPNHEDNYEETYDFIADQFRPFYLPDRVYIDERYKVTPKRLQLASKLLKYIENLENNPIQLERVRKFYATPSRPEPDIPISEDPFPDVTANNSNIS